jgi:hypothetical protein
MPQETPSQGWEKRERLEKHVRHVENWTKSKYTTHAGNCVEFRTRSKVQVRDSKLGENSPIMNLSLHTWQEAFKSVDWLL